MTIWIDAGAGASGDMLLGSLLGAGVPLEVLQQAVSAASPEPVLLRPEAVRRAGFAATHCVVEVADSSTHRTWRDIRALLERADLSEPVRDSALAVFGRLAVAEAIVHGADPMDVAFHEVGALDAIADVVGVCAGFAWLAERASPPPASIRATARIDAVHDQSPVRHADGTLAVVVSPVAVGAGTVAGAHGALPVPVPAVAELLRGAPTRAVPPGTGPEPGELCTPTGAALLATFATSWGPQPPMTVEQIGVGAGTRDPESHANVLRLFVGAPAETPAAVPLLIESNIDDLDPRVWPAVIAALLEAGASDAWLTPILMKKGRPAHTLSVLVRSDRAVGVRSAIFRHTSTIGLREQPLAKHALDREMVGVEVDGHQIPVKLARQDGVLLNAQPEYDDVARVALAVGRPVADVLADAVAASRVFFRG